MNMRKQSGKKFTLKQTRWSTRTTLCGLHKQQIFKFISPKYHHSRV